MNDFRLLMIGAMYENGGNTSHRFLDGHPDLYVYPFESQLGTRLVQDHLTSMFPVKYRWPVFDLQATPQADFHSIIDEEMKVRARTPHVSKFRDHELELSDDERRDAYVRIVSELGRSRANNVEAFFRATFETWHDRARSGREEIYVGYSPIIAVDAERILEEMPAAHFLHVVRNPWSAYADTKKRPVPLALETYMLGWSINQRSALLARERYPDRMHIVRTEDVMEDPPAALGPVLEAMGSGPDRSLSAPSWNGRELEEVYPWGTIRKATPQANIDTAGELTAAERTSVYEQAGPYVELLQYTDFAAQLVS